MDPFGRRIPDRFYQHDDLGGGPPPPPPPLPSGIEPEEDLSRDGPDWENRRLGLIRRWWNTVVGVFAYPTQTFSRMRVEGDLIPPLLFALIGGTIAGILTSVFHLAIEIAFLSGGDSYYSTTTGADFAYIVILTPILTLLSAVAYSGVKHVLLTATGGTTHGFEATFRCECYVVGALSVLYVIPFFGQCVYLVWYVIAAANAISLVQEIPLGRAYLVVIGSFFLCAGVGVGAAFLGVNASMIGF